MRVTFLGGKPLELLALKPIELKYKRCRSEVFPRDPFLRANGHYPYLKVTVVFPLPLAPNALRRVQDFD